MVINNGAINYSFSKFGSYNSQQQMLPFTKNLTLLKLSQFNLPSVEFVSSTLRLKSRHGIVFWYITNYLYLKVMKLKASSFWLLKTLYKPCFGNNAKFPFEFKLSKVDSSNKFLKLIDFIVHG